MLLSRPLQEAPLKTVMYGKAVRLNAWTPPGADKIAVKLSRIFCLQRNIVFNHNNASLIN
jgi:hypothetical protein